MTLFLTSQRKLSKEPSTLSLTTPTCIYPIVMGLHMFSYSKSCSKALHSLEVQPGVSLITFQQLLHPLLQVLCLLLPSQMPRAEYSGFEQFIESLCHRHGDFMWQFLLPPGADLILSDLNTWIAWSSACCTWFSPVPSIPTHSHYPSSSLGKAQVVSLQCLHDTR